MYNGFSPYECLYGCNPSPVFHEDSECLAQLGSDSTSFYEHAQVRAKAIAHFHQALLHTGLARINTSRPRSDDQKHYKVGEWVDIWRKPRNKEMAGWRGPCVILSLLGDGFVVVRWQGVCLDIPIHHCRPHVTATPIAALQSTGPPLRPISDKPKEEEPAKIVDAPSEEGATVYIEEKCFWNEVEDAIKDPSCFRIQSDVFPTLLSVAMNLSVNAQQVHAITLQGNKIHASEHLKQDGGAVFNLGKQFAIERNIPNYQGIILSCGRSHVQIMQGVRRNHIFSWTGDGTSEIVESVHDKMVNWISHGISHKDLSRHRFISILEGHSTGETSLSDMLTQSKLIEQEPEEFGPGRVRFKTGDDLPKIIEEIPPFEDDDMSSRRLSDFDTPSASEELALFLRSEETLKRSIGFQLRHSAYEHLNEDELYFSLVTDECQEESSSSTNHHPGSTTQPPSSDTQCFEDDKW